MAVAGKSRSDPLQDLMTILKKEPTLWTLGETHYYKIAESVKEVIESDTSVTIVVKAFKAFESFLHSKGSKRYLQKPYHEVKKVLTDIIQLKIAYNVDRENSPKEKKHMATTEGNRNDKSPATPETLRQVSGKPDMQSGPKLHVDNIKKTAKDKRLNEKLKEVEKPMSELDTPVRRSKGSGERQKTSSEKTEDMDAIVDQQMKSTGQLEIDIGILQKELKEKNRFLVQIHMEIKKVHVELNNEQSENLSTERSNQEDPNVTEIEDCFRKLLKRVKYRNREAQDKKEQDEGALVEIQKQLQLVQEHLDISSLSSKQGQQQGDKSTPRQGVQQKRETEAAKRAPLLSDIKSELDKVEQQSKELKKIKESFENDIADLHRKIEKALQPEEKETSTEKTSKRNPQSTQKGNVKPEKVKAVEMTDLKDYVDKLLLAHNEKDNQDNYDKAIIEIHQQLIKTQNEFYPDHEQQDQEIGGNTNPQQNPGQQNIGIDEVKTKIEKIREEVQKQNEILRSQLEEKGIVKKILIDLHNKLEQALSQSTRDIDANEQHSSHVKKTPQPAQKSEVKTVATGYLGKEIADVQDDANTLLQIMADQSKQNGRSERRKQRLDLIRQELQKVKAENDGIRSVLQQYGYDEKAIPEDQSDDTVLQEDMLIFVEATQNLSWCKGLIAKYESAEEKLGKLRARYQILEQDKDKLLERLSKIAGTRLTSGNAQVTDLSDPNRPQKIAEQYAEIYDNEWTDAYERMKAKYKKEEKDIIQKLLNIIKESFEFCCTQANNQWYRILATIVEAKPIDLYSVEELQTGGMKKITSAKPENVSTPDVKKLETEFGENDLHELHEMRKKSAPTSKDKVELEFRRQVSKEFNTDDAMISPYISKCITVCWYMAVQNPRLCLHYDVKSSDRMDENLFKAYTKSGKKFDFLVWPALITGTGKGKVVYSKGVCQPK